MEEVSLAVAGTHVYGRFCAARGKAGAVLVHGFGSSLREFGDLPERLAASGINALAIDLRGHGLSGGERGRIGLDRAIDDVEAAVAFLRDRLGRRARLAAVGHSLGGAYAVGIAGRTDWFEALVLAHPVDRIFDELKPLEKVVYHAVGRWAQRRQRRGKAAGMMPRRPLYRNLLVDPEARRAAREEGLLAARVNLGNYAFAVTMQASDWARRVEVPVLCVGSDRDRAVEPAHSRDVFEALAGPTEHLHHLGGHSCFLDLDREVVAQAVADFLRRHLGVRGRVVAGAAGGAEERA